MTNSARFNILPTKGNAALGIASPWDLAVGQIGFFDANTNTAITTNAQANAHGFYIALGVDTNEDGLTDDIRRSYRTIYPKGFVGYSQKCFQPFQPKIISFSNPIISFGTDYVIELHLNNPVLNNIDNNKDYIVEFLTYTTELQLNDSIQDPDIYKMYSSFVEQLAMNKKINGYISLKLQDPTTLATITNLATWVVSNPGIAPTMEFTIAKPALDTTMNAIYKYENPREVDVLIVPVKGFETNGTVTLVQEMLYESMSGIEVQELERIAGGWDANPGVIREYNAGLRNINYLSVISDSYNLLTLNYKYESESGSENYKNDMAILIAIPTSDTVTASAVSDMIGTLITGSATGLVAASC